MAIQSVNSGLNLNYQQLSSMKKINSAADDAAGLAIVNKMQSQSTGLDAGANNAAAGKDLLKTAEGGLSSISDSLQRMKELAVQASNGIYTAEDKAVIQTEIDQLKEGIASTAKNTEFNTIKVLDGSMGDMKLATNPNGTGSKIQMESSTLETLGIKDFDVTKSGFDISAIDDALKMVNSQRGSIGASSNALDSTVAYNNLASQNLVGSASKKEDLDAAAAVSDMKKNEVLNQYKNFVQNMKMEQERNTLGIFKG